METTGYDAYIKPLEEDKTLEYLFESLDMNYIVSKIKTVLSMCV